MYHSSVGTSPHAGMAMVLRAALVGPRESGKTALLIRFVAEHFIAGGDADMGAGLADSYRKSRVVGGQAMLWDVSDCGSDRAGSDFNSELVAQEVHGAEVVLFCYSVRAAGQLEAVQKQAAALLEEEIEALVQTPGRNSAAGADAGGNADVASDSSTDTSRRTWLSVGKVAVLVGTMCDSLRVDGTSAHGDSARTPQHPLATREVSFEKGVRVAAAMGCAAFFETSSAARNADVPAVPRNLKHGELLVGTDHAGASHNVFACFDYACLATFSLRALPTERQRARDLALGLSEMSSAKPKPWQLGKRRKRFLWSRELKHLRRAGMGDDDASASDPLPQIGEFEARGNGSASLLVAEKGSVQRNVEDAFPTPEVEASAVYADLARLQTASELESAGGASRTICPADIRLQFGDDSAQALDAHAVVLAIRSSFFRAMLTAVRPNARVPAAVVVRGAAIESISVLRHAVTFCYSAALSSDLTKRQVRELRRANELLDIDGLEDACDMCQIAHNDNNDDDDASDGTNVRSSPTLSPLVHSAAIQTSMAPGLTGGLDHLADCVLHVRETAPPVEFRVHRAILAARSAWFAALLSERFRENARDDGGLAVVDIAIMSEEVLRGLIEYLYTGRCTEIERTPDLAIDLLETAGALNLLRLVNLCERSLCALLDVENVVELCHAAAFHGAPRLVKACEHLIVRDYDKVLDVVGRERFAELPADVQERVTSMRKAYAADVAKYEERQREMARQGFRAHAWHHTEAGAYSTHRFG
jgi:BTB/POZ domain/Ras family